MLGKFHRPPLNPSKLESANYFAKQRSRQQLLAVRGTRRRAGGSGLERLRTSESRRGVFLSDKISQVKDIFRRTGGTLESVLRLVVPGHDRFKRKMEKISNLKLLIWKKKRGLGLTTTVQIAIWY